MLSLLAALLSSSVLLHMFLTQEVSDSQEDVSSSPFCAGFKGQDGSQDGVIKAPSPLYGHSGFGSEKVVEGIGNSGEQGVEEEPAEDCVMPDLVREKAREDDVPAGQMDPQETDYPFQLDVDTNIMNNAKPLIEAFWPAVDLLIAECEREDVDISKDHVEQLCFRLNVEFTKFAA